MGTILSIPYKSQETKTAGYSFNDCGPTCCAMMLAAIGQDVTVDSLYKHPSIAGVKGGLSITALQTLTKAYGLRTLYAALDLAGLKAKIDEGRPVMVLLDYAPVVAAKLNGIPTKGIFGHFVLVVGYEDNNIVIHDPYWKTDDGAYRRWPVDVFNKSWAGGPGSWGNTYNGKSVYPDRDIADPIAPAAPPYPMDEGLRRRIRAKALFEKEQTPTITNQQELDAAIQWLGTWGQYAEGYFIAVGDSLSSISQKRYGLPDFGSGLAAYNGITDPNSIVPGQKILLPIPTPNKPEEHPAATGTATATGTPAPSAQTYTFTNQQLVNAFYQTYKARGGDADDYWQAMVEAGLEYVSSNRQARYQGPSLDTLKGVPPDVLASIKRMLGLH